MWGRRVGQSAVAVVLSTALAANDPHVHLNEFDRASGLIGDLAGQQCVAHHDCNLCRSYDPEPFRPANVDSADARTVHGNRNVNVVATGVDHTVGSDFVHRFWGYIDATTLDYDASEHYVHDAVGPHHDRGDFLQDGVGKAVLRTALVGV